MKKQWGIYLGITIIFLFSTLSYATPLSVANSVFYFENSTISSSVIFGDERNVSKIIRSSTEIASQTENNDDTYLTYNLDPYYLSTETSSSGFTSSSGTNESIARIESSGMASDNLQARSTNQYQFAIAGDPAIVLPTYVSFSIPYSISARIYTDTNDVWATYAHAYLSLTYSSGDAESTDDIVSAYYRYPELSQFPNLKSDISSGSLTLGAFMNPGDTGTLSLVTRAVVQRGNLNSYIAPVPEPSTMLLLGSGLIGLIGLGRKKLLKK